MVVDCVDFAVVETELVGAATIAELLVLKIVVVATIVVVDAVLIVAVAVVVMVVAVVVDVVVDVVVMVVIVFIILAVFVIAHNVEVVDIVKVETGSTTPSQATNSLLCPVFLP